MHLLIRFCIFFFSFGFGFFHLCISAINFVWSTERATFIAKFVKFQLFTYWFNKFVNRFVFILVYSYLIHCRSCWITHLHSKHFANFSSLHYLYWIRSCLLFHMLFFASSYWLFIVFCFSEILWILFEYFDELMTYYLLPSICYGCVRCSCLYHCFIDFAILYVQRVFLAV